VIGRKALLMTTGAAALAGAPGLALGAGPIAVAAKKRTVVVADNYYSPAKLTIHAGDTVRWHWSDDTLDEHDVKVDKAPKGVKKFASDVMVAGDSFSKKLTKPGKYHIICTFHEEEMSMTITVKPKQ
jgi:plastocyanin